MSRMLQALKGIQARTPDGTSPPDEISPEELGTLGLARPLEPWKALPSVAADSAPSPRESADSPGQSPAAADPRCRVPELMPDAQCIVGSMVDTGPDWIADPRAADALAGFEPVVIDDRPLAASWPDVESSVLATADSFTADPIETIDRAGDDFCTTRPLARGPMELDAKIESVPKRDAPPVATEALASPPDEPSASFFDEPPTDTPEVGSVTATTREGSTPDRSPNDEPTNDNDRDLAYWHLAENVLSQVHPSPAVLMFTSPGAGSRKTMVVARLATMLARRLPGEVVAVDADWQGGGLGRQFGFHASRGLIDILSGRASWRDVLRTADGTRLNIIPRGAVKHRSSPEIDGKRLRSLLDSLRRHARLVLVNAPAATAHGIDPLASLCEAAYLVVRLGHTPGRVTRHAVTMLEESGIPLYGCVLTGA